MKKLYRKGTVHPSPPPAKHNDPLFPLLPVAIFSLAAVLSPEDREVLAYLLSTASYSGDKKNKTSRLKKTKPNKKNHLVNHSPHFHCDCFSCYTSYWVRWDTSPSRQIIHEIIDAFEDSLEKTKNKKVTRKKDRRKRFEKSPLLSVSSFGTEDSVSPSRLSESVPRCSCSSSSKLVKDGGGLEYKEEFRGDDGGEKTAGEEKGPVRRFVSFISEKVFSVWG